MSESTFNQHQLEVLQAAFHRGAADASLALSKWIDRRAVMSLEAIDQLPLADATELLGGEESPLCFGSMKMPTALPGELIVAFDDPSGLALADMVLSQPADTSTEWGEMQISAALESTNILCCAYLNAIVAEIGSKDNRLSELIPEPPVFRRDFAVSLLEFALMGQAIARDQVVVVRTKFEVDGEPLNWTLLWVPEAEALKTLSKLTSQ